MKAVQKAWFYGNPKCELHDNTLEEGRSRHEMKDTPKNTIVWKHKVQTRDNKTALTAMSQVGLVPPTRLRIGKSSSFVSSEIDAVVTHVVPSLTVANSSTISRAGWLPFLHTTELL